MECNNCKHFCPPDANRLLRLQNEYFELRSIKNSHKRAKRMVNYFKNVGVCSVYPKKPVPVSPFNWCTEYKEK